jgi:hypothetical protein
VPRLDPRGKPIVGRNRLQSNGNHAESPTETRFTTSDFADTANPIEDRPFNYPGYGLVVAFNLAVGGCPSVPEAPLLVLPKPPLPPDPPGEPPLPPPPSPVLPTLAAGPAWPPRPPLPNVPVPVPVPPGPAGSCDTLVTPGQRANCRFGHSFREASFARLQRIHWLSCTSLCTGQMLYLARLRGSHGQYMPIGHAGDGWGSLPAGGVRHIQAAGTKCSPTGNGSTK